MPSQHKHPPFSVRLPADDRERLLAFAVSTGRTVNAVFTAAVRDYLACHSGTAIPAVPAATFRAVPASGKPQVTSRRVHALTCKCGICHPEGAK